LGYLKIVQPEISATGNKRVGKRGNKIYVRNNGNGKRATKKTATGKWATENCVDVKTLQK